MLTADELQRFLAPMLVGGTEGLGVFDQDGAPYAVVARPGAPIARWEQLPADAEAAARGGGSFGLGGHVHDVKVLRAGTDRVGTLVIQRDVAREDERDRALSAACSTMLDRLIHAAFATWVTSELHLAASESSHRAIAQQNAELRRAVEHMRELDKLKSNFLATVSHELRTPLTSVIGFSEMLLEGIAGPLQPEQVEYVRTILLRGEELLDLITRLLETSQLEVGALRLNLQPHAIAQVVARAVESVRLAATQNEVTISVEIPELPAVLVDVDGIGRVVVNLLSNAIKFSRRGGRVTVTAARAPIRRPFEGEALFGEETPDAVLVTVRDEGVGIPEEALGRIFEAFYQVDSSPTRQHGGAGLGLSIVRSLVTAHGGEVWAESALGQGTSMRFTVPIARSGSPP
jgi:signal transduction histidine kinase